MAGALASEQLWLGALVGAQLLLVLLCTIQANAYRERPLLLHAAATLVAVLAVQALVGQPPLAPRSMFLLVPALAGLQLLDLVTHAGGLRLVRRALVGVSAVVVPLLALAALYSPWFFLLALLLWSGVVGVVLLRVWHQSQPWIWWLLPGVAALLVAGASLWSWQPPTRLDTALLLAALLTAWSACGYLATCWRGRIYGESRIRIQARNTIDPLTGLATPLVLAERVHAARHLVKRYGHPSVLMVVHIENLPQLAQEFGLEAAESAVLAAASRVRDALMRDGDIAARLAHARIGVLAEGVALGQAAATVAGRILVAGLKEPLAAAPAEYLRFRIVLATVPAEELPPKQLLQRLNNRLDLEVQGGSERRIVSMTQDEVLEQPIESDF